MNRRLPQIATIVAGLCCWTGVRADLVSSSYDLHIFNATAYAANADLSYVVEVIEVINPQVEPNQALFRISNQSTDMDSVITGIYFDDGVLLGIQEVIFPDEAGMTVEFHQDMDVRNGGVSPPDLPGGQEIGFEVSDMDGAKFAADADAPPTKNGLNNGEYVDILFNLINDGSVYDVIGQMNDGTIRVGVHIQSLGDGGTDSASGVTIFPIPAPGALALGAIGLCLVGWYRRRENRSDNL